MRIESIKRTFENGEHKSKKKQQKCEASFNLSENETRLCYTT